MRARASLLFLLAVAGCRDYSRIAAGVDNDGSVEAAAEVALEVGPDAASRYPNSLTCASPARPSCQGASPASCGGESCCTECRVVYPDATASLTFDRGWDATITATTPFPVTQREGNSAKEEPIAGAQRKLQARTTISAPFWLDRFEVTIGRFRPFWKDYTNFLRMHPKPEDGAHPTNADVRWHEEWNGRAGFYAQTSEAMLSRIDKVCAGGAGIAATLQLESSPLDDHPMACVTWYEAFLFCVFDGQRRLPTEAEWNFAAAGGDEGRPYPWGTPDPLNVPPDLGNVLRPGSGGASVAVGTFPGGAGKWGHVDLAGNVWELVFDTTDADGDVEAYVDQNVDPVQLFLPPVLYARIARGGSFAYGPARARTAYRKTVTENATTYVAAAFNDLGWRCAR